MIYELFSLPARTT